MRMDTRQDLGGLNFNGGHLGRLYGISGGFLSLIEVEIRLRGDMSFLCMN